MGIFNFFFNASRTVLLAWWKINKSISSNNNLCSLEDIPNIYEFLERVNLKNIKYTDYVGFGDIDYKNTAYDELKDSKEEIISSSVHFRNKQIFLGKDANTH